MAASLSPASAFSQRIGRGFETALSLSCDLAFGRAGLLRDRAADERQKPCDDQHTITYAECRKLLGAKD